MKKGFSIVIFMFSSQLLLAQNEIGPEGHKLLWLVLILVVVSATFIFTRKSSKKGDKAGKPFITRRNISVTLEKDRLYYPDNLTLRVKNKGNSDVDLDKPLLELDNFWMKRKFKIKGMENRTFYPLYLEKGKTHTLHIDLTRFYRHDKSLKKFPKAKVILSDVNGKKIGSKSIFLRKTLFRF